jgi:aryl-alcohol dehydrogenase-like predicted oxidoreductase
MKEKHNKIDRRDFLKTVPAAALGSVLASTKANAMGDPNKAAAPEKKQQTKYPQVPRRKLGKTGVDVPVLSLGMMFNVVESQIVLRKTLDWGANYWDTANGYSGGNSELGIGKFLSKNPKVRKNVFIVSKATSAGKEPTSQARVKKVEERLQTSFERMNTNYIDLYYGIHGIDDPTQLDEPLRRWAENAKKEGRIRLFGFSTHKNMVACLNKAARLDWIDAVMTTYNFRLMCDKEMTSAIDACHKAGIGIIAMKTVGLTPRGRKLLEPNGKGIETEQETRFLSHFLKRGFTPGQAKIKAVLEDERISSACVKMQNVALVTSNATAVVDKTKLSAADMGVLAEYAKATCSGYCAGCSSICERALSGMPYVSDIMRYLMYYNSYGDQDIARELFAQIPADVRNKLLSIDYKPAEAKCPQNMPIGNLMAEAAQKLA